MKISTIISVIWTVACILCLWLVGGRGWIVGIVFGVFFSIATARSGRSWSTIVGGGTMAHRLDEARKKLEEDET